MMKLKRTLKIVSSAILAVCATLSAEQNRAAEFPLDDVRLDEYSTFYRAMMIDKDYLFKLDIDRFFVKPRITAKLKPKAEKQYPAWADGNNSGHVQGHLLSALSTLYASTHAPEVLEKINYIVDEFEAVQNPDGSINTTEQNMKVWRESANAFKEGKPPVINKTIMFGLWVPFYIMHKMPAGLRDAWLYTGNEKAKNIYLKFCDWLCDYMDNFTDEQFEQMLATEHGGMNEILADAAAITSDKARAARYLKNAKKFSHKEFLIPLSKNEDVLPGKHANTQIPKFVGFKRISEIDPEAKIYRDAAYNFWNMVINTQILSIGGNSFNEHFSKPNEFADAVNYRSNVESCNTYNMLKLTELLFADDPQSKYADFYERALYNHILSTQNNSEPDKGGFVYMTPMRPGYFRTYSSVHTDFWCCVSTGYENHTKYGKFIYSHSGDSLYVNLFIASTLNWKNKGLVLNQANNFPNTPSTSFEIASEKPEVEFELKIRKPFWVKANGLEVSVNGEKRFEKAGKDGYVRLTRKWKNGDKIDVSLPMTLRAEILKGKEEFACFMYGPILLASPMGTLEGDEFYDGRHIAKGKFIPLAEIPFLRGNIENVLSAIKKAEGSSLRFEIPNTISNKGKKIELLPFADIHMQRYAIYFPYGSEKEFFDIFNDKYGSAEEKFNARILDSVDCGEQQPEIDHEFKMGKGKDANIFGRSVREAYDYLQYKLKIDPKDFKKDMKISFFFERFGSHSDRGHKIFINGELFLDFDAPLDKHATVMHEYPLPKEIVEKSNGEFLIRFERKRGPIGPFFRVGISRMK